MPLDRVRTALPWQRLLAEFTVIVAGVLIALAVDAWWEQRQERAHAREYTDNCSLISRKRHTETLIWNSTERVTTARARHSQSAARRQSNGGRGWGQVDVAAALTDPEIIGALQFQIAASQIRLFNLGRLEEPIDRLIELLRAELN